MLRLAPMLFVLCAAVPTSSRVAVPAEDRATVVRVGVKNGDVIDVPADGYADLTFDVPSGAVVIQRLDGPVVQKSDGLPQGRVIFRADGTVKVSNTIIHFKTEKADQLDFTVNFGPPKPQPKPDPGPQPNPDPGPHPNPQPAGQVAYFVVVEDTAKAQAWRGDILGSPVVAAAYARLQGAATEPVHRLISVGTDLASAPAEVHRYVELAKGKDLPWLFLLDTKRQPIRDLKAPTDPQAFADAIAPPVPHQRAMGNNPPDDGRKRTWKVFGAHPNVPLIPREQWKEVDLGWALPPVKDQDGIGACNAFATITAVEAARKQAGLRYVRLSPGYLYGKINGGRDQGSLLEDALAWMTDHGTVSAATIGELDWRRGRAYSGDAEGQSYRIVEAYECPSFDAMASAIQQGFYIDEGLMWYDNFKPDRDGWLPASGRGGAGGHALCGYGLAKRTDASGKVVWGIKTRNSWGSGWGVGGNCVIPESLFGRGIGGFWAVRAVTPTPTAFSARLDLRSATDREYALAP